VTHAITVAREFAGVTRIGSVASSVMGHKRAATLTRPSSSPTADRLLRDQQIERWIADLVVPHRSRDAANALLQLGPIALPAVEEGLLAEDPGVRAACTRLLDRLANNDSFDLMLLLLDDPDPRVRSHAMHALACDRCKADDVCALPRAQIIPTAARVLAADPHPPVRTIALEVLGRWVHDDDVCRAAIERARVDDPDPMVRKKAKWYLPGGRIFERTKPRR
jgi:HEAT repeat protein